MDGAIRSVFPSEPCSVFTGDERNRANHLKVCVGLRRALDEDLNGNWGVGDINAVGVAHVARKV